MAKRLTKAQKARNKKAREQAKRQKEFARMYQQVKEIYKERNLSRYADFNKVLKKAGINPNVKNISKEQLKAIKKLQTATGVYTAVWRTMSYKQLMQHPEFARQREEVNKFDKMKDQASRIIQSAIIDFDGFLDYYSESQKYYIANWQRIYQLNIDIIDKLKEVLSTGSEEEKQRLANLINEYYRLYGSVTPETLYDRIPEAHSYIVVGFESIYNDFDNEFFD